MAIRPIRIIGDPVLRTVCDPVTEVTDSVRTLVEDLLEGVDMEGRAGLAANQIGVGLRAFSYNIDGQIGYVLNPTIVELSEAACPSPSCGTRPSGRGTRAARARTWTGARSSWRARSSWPGASSTRWTT